MKNRILSLLILGVLVMMVGFAGAVHTSSVSVSPSGWLKQGTSYDFSFTVTNNGPDAVNDVTIDADSQFGSVTCGPAPTGWVLYLSSSSLCRYTTNIVANFITAGNNKVFTVTAPTLASFGDKAWLITTRESGEVGAQYNNIYSTVQTIQNAINSASSGATINVPAGTYVEGPQIVINKNLNIVGADKNSVIIKPFGNTGTYSGGTSPPGDTSGWFLIQSGVNVNITGITLDGSGKDIAIGILTYGSGNIYDNIIKNIKYGPDSAYRGFGVMLWNSNMAVNNNEFSNFNRIGVLMKGSSSNGVISGNTFNCKGVGDWLDYAVELGAGARGIITGNTISNCRGVASVDNSTSAGILVTTYYGSGTQATITGNTISNSYDAIAVGYDTSDTSMVTANNNILIGNTYGIENTASIINAINNWWGTSVESEIQALITGAGSANVLYDPWWYGPTNPVDTTKPTVTFNNAPYFSSSTTVTINATITDDRDVERYVLDFGDGSNVTDVNVTGNHNLSVNVVVSHPYANGDYVVSLTAYDRTGNHNIKTTSVSIDSTPYNWRIPLKTGWNLISFPMIPTDSAGNVNKTVSNVFKTIYDKLPGGTDYVIYQYDARTETWKKARRTSYGDLTEIVPGYAYWVKVTEDTVLKGYGTKLDSWQMPPSVNLGRSWNLIGKYGSGSVALSYETNNLVFDSELGNLKDYPIMYDGTFLDDTTDSLEPFLGYWTLMPGNNGNLIKYTVSLKDYA